MTDRSDPLVKAARDALEVLADIANQAADMVDPGTATGRPWHEVDLKVARRIHETAFTTCDRLAAALKEADHD